MIKAKSINKCVPFGRNVIQSHPDYKSTLESKNENWFISPYENDGGEIEEEVYWKGCVAVVSTIDVSTNEFYLKQCYTVDTTIKDVVYAQFQIKHNSSEKSRCLCILEQDCLTIYPEHGEQYVAAIPFKVKNLWSIFNGVCVERESNNTDDEKKSIPTLFSLTHPLEDFKPIVYRYQDSKKPMYFTDSAQHIVFSDAKLSMVLMYDTVLGLHSLWTARKAEEKDFPEALNNNDSLPEFLTFNNHSIVGLKDHSRLSFSPVQNKRHSCPPIPFHMQTKKFSPSTHVESPLAKVHSPIIPAYKNSPHIMKGGHESLGEHSAKRLSHMSSPMMFRLSCDESMLEEELEPLPPDVCLQQVWQEKGSHIRYGMKGKADVAFVTKDFSGALHLGYFIKSISKLKLLRLTYGVDDTVEVEKVKEVDCLHAGALKKHEMMIVLDMSQHVQLYSAKQKICGLSIQSFIGVQDLTKQNIQLKNFANDSFCVEVLDENVTYRIEIAPLTQSTRVMDNIHLLKDILKEDEYNLIYSKYFSLFHDENNITTSHISEFEKFMHASLKLMGFPEYSTKSLKENNHSPAPPQAKKAKKSESAIGNEDWEYLLANGPQQQSSQIHQKTESKPKFIVEISLQKHAPLYNYIATIFLAWNQLYEEMKLNIVASIHLYSTAKLLHYLGLVLRSKCHVMVYERDFPELSLRDADTLFKFKEDHLHLSETIDCIQSIEEISLFDHLIGQILPNQKSASTFKSNHKYSKVLTKIYSLMHSYNHKHNGEHDGDHNEEQYADGHPPEDLMSKLHLIDRKEELMDKIIDIMIKEEFTLEDLEKLPLGYRLPILSILYQSKDCNHTNLSIQSALFLGRDDIVEMKANLIQKNKIATMSKDDKSGMSFDEVIFSFRFHQDLRIEEVKKLLNSSEQVNISLVQKPDVNDHNFAKEEEARLVLASNRTMALSVGRGMFTLDTSTPMASETVFIPPLELSGRSTSNNKTVSMPNESPNTKLYWPHFHNGVAAGLKVAPSATEIVSTWILFNKPKTCNLTAEHSGLLLALGLTGHLKVLPKLHLHDYLIKGHELTTVALLIGTAATQIGSKNSSTYKLLCLHLDSLLPPTALELSIPSSNQVAAIISLGLLFFQSADIHLVKILLYEIGRSPGVEGEHTTDHESHSLSAGFALGMLLMGLGKDTMTIADINVGGVLYHYINGGQKSNIIFSKLQERKGGSSQIEEGESINTNVTAPSGIIALSLMYFKTNNKTVSDWLNVPLTENMMNTLEPDVLLLRMLGYNLIMWDELLPTKTWITKFLPEYDTLLESMNPGGESKLDIHYLISVVTGCFLALALKFAGSANLAAYNMMLPWINEIKSLLKTSLVEELGAKIFLEKCLHTVLLALSVVMAGTGNIKVLRAARQLHKRCSSDVTYGSHMSVHMAIGFLFLGGGAYNLKTDKVSIACLLCSIYPKWPANSKDNRFHMQALRHLYVLACEPRLFTSRDIDTKKICYTPIKVTLKETCYYEEMSHIFLSPCLIPEVHLIKKIEVLGPRYLPITLTFNKRFSIKDIANVFVKKKAAFLAYDEDPKGKKNLLGRTYTNQSEKLDLIKSFNSSDEVELFQELFCKDIVSKEHQVQSELYLDILHECVTKEKLKLLKDFIHLAKILEDMEDESSTNHDTQQLLFLLISLQSSSVKNGILSPLYLMKIRLRLLSTLQSQGKQAHVLLSKYL